MPIVQQIIGLVLGGFAVFFMLWFLGNLIHESRTRYRRHAQPSVAETESWQFRTLGPQVPSSSAGVSSSSSKGALRPLPQFGHGSRFPHIASR
jgi:hypothetical protein